MNIRRRLAALEDRVGEPVLLMMPDGSTASIPGRSDHLLKLLTDAAGGANINPKHSTQLDLIRRSTGAIESNGGRMIELIQCCLLGPRTHVNESRVSVTSMDPRIT